MTEEDLYKHIFASRIFTQWHYFTYHFTHKLRGSDHPFAASLVSACLKCEENIPGFAIEMIDKLASISGKEKHIPHYEQLLQCLAEIHIINQLVVHKWPFKPQFKFEPTLLGHKKNPELLISGGKHNILIEVKAPSIISHINKRGSNDTQIVSRFTDEPLKYVEPEMADNVTLPRDGPIKDFLVSADNKFAQFKKIDDTYKTILVIVWDDFINEPISSLLHKKCGLLTENSFALNEEGKRFTFDNIDGIIIIRHLHQIIRATRDKPFIDGCLHTFDYGNIDKFPPKVIINNPTGSEIPQYIIDAFQAVKPSPLLGAEYCSGDLVWWINAKD